MTVQEIFNTVEVKEIEKELLNLMMDEERVTTQRDSGKVAIQHLLKIRKRILNDMFELTDEYKQLLSEFNSALINAQCDMRKRVLALMQCTREIRLGDIEFTGKVFMSYKYSEIHPVQNMRAKKIWGVLNGSYDSYMPLYEDGVNTLRLSSDEIPSENDLVYLSEETDNWNEGLDREQTADMKLCYAFHDLYEHNDFSIFDLLWVRDFCIEVSYESDYCTGSTDWDDIDRKKYDYYK